MAPHSWVFQDTKESSSRSSLLMVKTSPHLIDFEAPLDYKLSHERRLLYTMKHVIGVFLVTVYHTFSWKGDSDIFLEIGVFFASKHSRKFTFCIKNQTHHRITNNQQHHSCIDPTFILLVHHDTLQGSNRSSFSCKSHGQHRCTMCFVFYFVDSQWKEI